jgi:hypothetical protein
MVLLGQEDRRSEGAKALAVTAGFPIKPAY